MSDLDNAINSINESAVKAENTATFLDDMSTFDDQSSVTNPNNGQTVASIPKQVKDRTDELFTAAESEINQAVATTAQNASEAVQSASEAATSASEAVQSASEAATTVETQIRERVGIYKIGNISDYAGQQLTENKKENQYQFPDDSDKWYGPDKDQVFPITIPSDPSIDNGWALVTDASVDIVNLGDSELSQGKIWPITPGFNASVGDVISDIKYIRIGGKIYSSVQSLSGSIDSIGTDSTQVVSIVVGGASYTLTMAKVIRSSTGGLSAEVGGSELIDGAGWVLGSGWSGDFANGFTHAKGGSTALLTKPIAVTSGNFYQVSVRVVSPSSSRESNAGWEVSLAGSPYFEMYEGNFTDNTYVRGLRAGSGSLELSFKPFNTFDGTLLEISVKEITGIVRPDWYVQDENEDNITEITATLASQENVFLGKDNATKNTTGRQSVGVGFEALRNNTTGFWNTAVGRQALQQNTVGSRNVALGYIALRNNSVGDRNIAIGSFALLDNVSGRNNIGLGADVLQRNIDGSGNIAIGLANLSGSLATSINGNVAIGEACMPSCGTDYNIGMGYEAGNKITTGNEQIAIGRNALRENSSGGRNLVIGHNSLNNPGATNVNRNLVIGTNSAQNMISGAQFNVVLGHNCANGLTTGDSNIVIGYNLTIPAVTDSFRLNIGDTLRGVLSSINPRVTFGKEISTPQAVLHLPSGGESSGSGAFRLSSGSLLSVPSAGVWEYVGSNLYFTNEDQARHSVCMSSVTPVNPTLTSDVPFGSVFEMNDGSINFKKQNGTIVVLSPAP